MINKGLLWPCSHSDNKNVFIWHQNKMLGAKQFSKGLLLEWGEDSRGMNWAKTQF